MTSKIFTEWIKDWERVCREKGQKISFLEKFAGNSRQRTLANIIVEKFEPNVTSHVQPMDV